MSTPKEGFAQMYEGEAPWDIGRPQPAFVLRADRIQGSVLDVGCGTGEHCLFFAARGQKTTGVDFLDLAIERAKAKAAARGLSVNFLVMDATEIGELPELFDSVVDSGLFHCLDDDARAKYVAGLASVVRPGGRVSLMCFSDAEPEGQGPRRIKRSELLQSFASGWYVEQIEPVHFEIAASVPEGMFSPGGPQAWFATFRRSDGETDQLIERSAG